jgi:ribosome-associated protein
LPSAFDPLVVNENLSISEATLQESFVRSSGPGGQNVNKVATAVQLSFDVGASDLPADVKERLRKLAGSRLDSRDVLHIDARRARTREQNRRDARQRLVELVRQAAIRPKDRRATRPTRASRRRRLDEKRNAGRKKSLRSRVERDDDQ